MKYEEINSFEKACEVIGEDPAVLPIVDHLLPTDQAYQLASFKMPKIIKAVNKLEDGEAGSDVFPDYNNLSQPKYEDAWRQIKADEEHPAGFGFSLSSYVYVCTYARCGSRFALRDRKRWEFVNKKFEQLLIDLKTGI